MNPTGIKNRDPMLLATDKFIDQSWSISAKRIILIPYHAVTKATVQRFVHSTKVLAVAGRKLTYTDSKIEDLPHQSCINPSSKSGLYFTLNFSSLLHSDPFH